MSAEASEPSRKSDGADQSQASWLPFACWIVSVAGFVLFVSLANVPTRLGEKAFPFSKIGSDYVWRIWWRGLDSMVSIRYPLLMHLALALSLALFLAAIAAALWIALGVGDDAPFATVDDD